MLKLLSVVAVAFAISTSGEAMTRAPAPQMDGMVTHVAWGCGPGRTRVHGVCVARTTIRQTRRCLRWHGHICARYY